MVLLAVYEQELNSVWLMQKTMKRKKLATCIKYTLQATTSVAKYQCKANCIDSIANKLC